VLDDVNDVDALEAAVKKAKEETTRPSLIKVRSHIAFGSPNKVDTKESHGAALGVEEVKLVKKNLGFNPDESFVIPEKVLGYYRQEGKKGATLEKEWNEQWNEYKKQYPDLAREYTLLSSGKLPDGWQKKLPTFKAGDKVETRKASGKTLNAIADSLPLLIGGSADLAPSTDTNLEKHTSFSSDDRTGRNFHFGIREHSMGAILNGIAVTKGFTPYGATFLIFSEYMRPPIRLAAIMKLRPIFIYTHDSIGLGEDGTTHQPVEQVISLRSIPNLTVIRPADANETAQAWRVTLEHSGGPVALILTRQKLPVIDQDKYAKATNLEKGAYVLTGGDKEADVILIATGSEVSLIMQAAEQLEKDGIATRVVSMPSWELFEKQDAAYKESVLPKASRKRLAVEAGSPLGWLKYTTDDGDVIGITKFGESAPGEEVMKEYGFSVDNVVNRAKALVGK